MRVVRKLGSKSTYFFEKTGFFLKITRDPSSSPPRVPTGSGMAGGVVLDHAGSIPTRFGVQGSMRKDFRGWVIHQILYRSSRPISMDCANSEGWGHGRLYESLCIARPSKSSPFDSWTLNRVGRHPEWSHITSLTIAEAGGTRSGLQIGFLGFSKKAQFFRFIFSKKPHVMRA